MIGYAFDREWRSLIGFSAGVTVKAIGGGEVLLLGLALLERFVHADVAFRMAANESLPPVTDLVLLALIAAVASLVAYTFQALLHTVLGVRADTDGPGQDEQPGTGSLSMARSAPVGGTGPRAPADAVAA